MADRSATHPSALCFRFAYEESLRVPLIIKDPRTKRDLIGTSNDEFTLNLDLAPTILGAAGVTPPKVMQGRDMSQLYRENHVAANQNWRKTFLYEYHDDSPHIPDSLALVGRGFKLIHWVTAKYWQFFDLTVDPKEKRDVYRQTDPEQLASMKKQMYELQQTVKLYEVTV